MIKDKQRERLKKILENHCAVSDCKAYGQDCTAEDCASCLADHILADGWIRPKLKEEADIDDLIDMDYDD